jgi:signal-transduction protein with cAMP-binding, CBS, and nucleotidyltransferase domain
MSNGMKTKHEQVAAEKKGLNPWVQHVKAYAKQNGCTYKEALKKAKETYKK